MSRPVRLVLLAILAVVPALALGSPSVAGAAPLSVTPLRTIPMQYVTYPPRPYALGADGTIWVAEKTGTNSGLLTHLDDEGNNLGDGFAVNFNGFLPRSIGAHGNRVYVVQGTEPGLLSYTVVTSDPGHDQIHSDVETNYRDIEGASMRVYADGKATFAMGEKVATLDLTNVNSGHPFYPQAYYGAGINKGLTEDNTYVFESCVLGTDGKPVAGEPDPNCGKWDHSYGPGTPTGLDAPTDMAPAPAGFLVTEGAAGRVTHLSTVNAGALPDYEFGGTGEGAGQLYQPISIVQQPGTPNYFVGEQGNRRISVFDYAGGYLGTFGYGVRDGLDIMEVCGIEGVACHAGVPSSTDPRSSINRLDFGPDGNLYVSNPAANQIQVFAVSGGETPGGGGGGSTGGGSTAGGSTGGGAPGGSSGSTSGGSTGGGSQAKAEPDKVRLRAAPLKVEKGEKTTLTAIVNPPSTCASRKVLFQAKDGHGWDNLGKAIKVGRTCQVPTKAKVTEKTVFRVTLLTAGSHTLATSPNVTVKLK